MFHTIKDRNVLAIFIFVMTAAFLMPVVSIFVIQPMYLKLMLKSIEDEAVRTTKHVSHMLFSIGEDGSLELTQLKRKSDLRQIADDLQLYKLKIFNKTGTVILSTDEQDVGTINKHDYFHTVVGTGQMYTKIVHKDALSSEGQQISADVVETYVPVMKEDVFLGAMELYYDISKQNRQLRSVQIFSNSLMVVLSGLLILIFIFFMVRLDSSIKKKEETEKELIESEERFRQVAEDAEEWIWEVDQNGLYTFASPVCEKKFGLTPDQIIGKKHFYDFFIPEERELLKKRAFAFFERKEKIKDMVNRNLGRDGNTLWISTSGRPILDKHFNLLGYRGVDKDITQSMEYEEALVQDKIEFEALAANLSAAKKAIETNRNNLLIAFQRISNLIQDVSLTQNVSIRYNNAHLKKCYELKQCQQVSCPCYGKEPQRCWQIAGTFCGGEIQGPFAQKYGNCRDCDVFPSDSEDPADVIGEHFNNMMHMLQMTHNDLKESEERFRAISETSSDAIISTDDKGTVTFWNNAATEVFGYSGDEIVGKSVEYIIPNRFRKAHQDGLKRVLTTGISHVVGSRPVEVIGFCKDGSEFPLELSLAIWKRGGKTFFTGIIRDITGRKEIEVALRQDKEVLEKLTDELQRTNEELKNTQAQMLQREKMASVGQLAAGVAHEINNPMGFITSNLGSLQKYFAKYTGFISVQEEALKALGGDAAVEKAREKLKLDFIIDDTEDLLAESLDGAKRVTEIVQNLKSFSRIDAAERSLASMNECLDTTLKIVWNELKYKAEIKKEYGELSETFCNPQEINQVFMNLLVNAAQAIEKQGVITLRTWEEDGSVKVSVSDTGSGIPEDKLQRIFDPFYTTKEVGKGTGLGLSICYDIVKKHEGKISVVSEPDTGTTFTVSLPVRKDDK